MITKLEITGFRGHEHRVLDGLARVNLLVGPNNAGKTAVLDAVELIVRDGHPRALYEQAVSRGGQSEAQQLPVTVRHLFFGHAKGAEASFMLKASGEPERTIRVDFKDAYDDTQIRGTGTVSISRDALRAHKVGVGNHSVASGDLHPRARTTKVERIDPGPPDEAELHGLWADIVGNPAEDLVIEALRLVDPKLDRVVFAPAMPANGGTGTELGPIYVRRSDEPERIPLTTMGEGVRRMLSLAIHLVSAKGGTLLIDEIDDGLHFRVMTGLWGFLIKEARRLNVQVFATTHSADCVNAVGWLHRTTPDRLEDVAVLRIDPKRVVAPHYSTEDIDDAIELQTEVR